jgi:hypothetical protein
MISMSGMLRFRSALLFVIALVALALAPACAKEEPAGLLQPKDLTKPTGLEADFDKNNILDTASFTDSEAVDAAVLQKFLHKTIYDRATFLETYQSNGVRAADAIATAGRQYRINPLVLLVFTQVLQGLVGEQNYPFPPERVEYVFRCGCLQGSNCMAELAGFNRQVDCLARSLRVALDQITQKGSTAAGWGIDTTSLTLDSEKVTPTTEATAAIYDRLPKVAAGGEGGTWVFWNVYNQYALAMDYVGPVGGGAGGGWIGDACTTAASCGISDKQTCATNYPDGLCTVPCDGSCPNDPSRPEAFCADFKDNGGYCLVVCNLGAPSCRKGYKCVRLKQRGSNDSKAVCTLDQ